jgi:hypothetical protein
VHSGSREAPPCRSITVLTRFLSRPACLAAMCLVFFAARPAYAATITLNATASGFYHSNGTFFASGNYAVGWYPASSPPGELRDYFVFDLSGVSGVITAATLRAQNPATGYSSPDPSETWSIFDVSTNLTTLTSGAGGVGAFNDLGTGTGYGSVTVNLSSNSTNVDVLLNASGLAFLNSAIGRPPRSAARSPRSTSRTRRNPRGYSMLRRRP